MLKKETFIKLMEELLVLKDIERECAASFSKLDPDFSFWSLSRYEAIAVDAITEAMEDDLNEYISFWLYELDAGKEADSIDLGDEEVPFKTLEDLYNLLVRKKYD